MSVFRSLPKQRLGRANHAHTHTPTHYTTPQHTHTRARFDARSVPAHARRGPGDTDRNDTTPRCGAEHALPRPDAAAVTAPLPPPHLFSLLTLGFAPFAEKKPKAEGATVPLTIPSFHEAWVANRLTPLRFSTPFMVAAIQLLRHSLCQDPPLTAPLPTTLARLSFEPKEAHPCGR